METGETIRNSNPTPTIFEHGKLVLESLQYREEAARFHAARVDLQAAMLQAETGDATSLERWLTTYQSLAVDTPELQSLIHRLRPVSVHTENYSSSVSSSNPTKPPHFPLAIESQTPIPSAASTDEFPILSDLKQTFTPNIATAPWDDMICGALERGTISSSDLLDNPKYESCDTRATLSIESASADLEIQHGEFKKPISEITNEFRSVTEPLDSISNFQTDDEPTEKSTAEKQPLAFESFAQPSLPGATLNAIQEKPKSLKERLLGSRAFLLSTATHLLILFALSIYVIRITQPPELLAIVASPVEGEPVAMDAPLEMNPSESIDMTTTEMSTTNSPTMTSSVSGGSAGDIALPASLASGIGSESSGPSIGSGSGVGDGIGAGTGIGSPSAGAQFYGVTATGNTFCFIVDSSPSMKKDNAFAAAKQELLRSLSLMKPKQRYYIFFFGEDVERMSLNGREPDEFPVYATPDNLKKTYNWISRVKVQSNGKPPNDALDAAIELEPDGIFLLFDGDTKADVAAHLRRSNRVKDLISGENIRVPIHTLGFYTEKFDDLMKRIAKENGGVYRFIPKPPTVKSSRDPK